jgi:hypothetical protein
LALYQKLLDSLEATVSFFGECTILVAGVKVDNDGLRGKILAAVVRSEMMTGRGVMEAWETRMGHLSEGVQSGAA